MSSPTLLVVAKAPVVGQVKTRLAEDLGGRYDVAAELAAAALLDTLLACNAAVGAANCRLALAGDLHTALGARQISVALQGWTVVDQRGQGLGERLAQALMPLQGPVVQIGMDTPQVTPEHLHHVLRRLAGHDAVLAAATDGGWWALGLQDGRAAAPLAAVPMSTTTAYDDTHAALAASGLRISDGPVLTDVDRAPDMRWVARISGDTHFARRVRRIGEAVTP